MSDEPNLWEGIKDKPYCNPSKRMDFVLIFDVKDGNPNGDPDAGNLPRMDPATCHGIVTDVCIKRKVRDYLAAVLARPIYIQSQDALNTLYFRAAQGVEEAKKHVVEVPIADDDLKRLLTVTKKDKLAEPSDDDIEAIRQWLETLEAEGLEYLPNDGKLTYFGEAKSKDNFKQLLQGEEEPQGLPEKAVDKVAQALADAKKRSGGARLGQDVREKVKAKMCELYDDIRLFGGVLTAGTNAGQIRGPMQLTFARSVEPILQMDAAITRCAITRAADRARKQTEFGRKPWLSWAVYRQHGFFNPLLGRQTSVTKEDLARFWEALACMFPNSASASKGEMATQELLVFVHENGRGNWPSHKLFERAEIKPNGQDSASRVFAKHWTVTVEGWNLDKAKSTDGKNWPGGVTVATPLADIWSGKS
jgi:CRISPR-associated protein Csd2